MKKDFRKIELFYCDKCGKDTKHYVKSMKCIGCLLSRVLPKRTHLTEEHKRKIALAHKGKTILESTKEKLRTINLGKRHSEETKNKMKNSRNEWLKDEGNYSTFVNGLKRGWHHTDECKESLKKSGGWNMKKRYKALDIEEIYIYLISLPQYNAFKVGVAKEERRIKQVLRQSKDDSAKVIFRIKGDIDSICSTEKEIHNIFKNQHIVQDNIQHGKTEIYPRKLYEQALEIIDKRLFI